MRTEPWHDDVLNLLHDLSYHWDLRDPYAISDLFEPDGVLINIDGTFAEGADDVGAHLATVFAARPTGRFIGSCESMRRIGFDLVLMVNLAGIIPDGQDHLDPDQLMMQVVLARETRQGWKVTLMQHTVATQGDDPIRRLAIGAVLEAQLATMV